MITGLILLFLGLLLFSLFKKFDLFAVYLWLFICVLLISCLYSRIEVFHRGFLLDGISLNLIVLSAWVSSLIILRSYKIIKYYEKFIVFKGLILGLLSVLLITFLVVDLINFYFFFEASLIPTLIIIMGWGYQPERMQAGVYFIFYTLTASLPLLLVVIYLYNYTGRINLGDYSIFINLFTKFYPGLILFLISGLAFLVKLPMYFTHLWLPKAHVEAPVAGSMILAGVLLKLGGYGLIRVSFVLKFLGSIMVGILVGLSLFGTIYVGLMCCRLNDFKALVAYSSVAHIAIVIRGRLIINLWGIMGSLMMIIRHGLSSSGLFCIVNIYYERFSRRRFYINRGLILFIPLLTLMMFILAVSNIAAPPTINLISEICLIISLIRFNYFIVLVFPVGSFLGAVFTIFIYSFSQHGKRFVGRFSFSQVFYREAHIIVIHLLPVYLALLRVNLFLMK